MPNSKALIIIQNNNNNFEIETKIPLTHSDYLELFDLIFSNYKNTLPKQEELESDNKIHEYIIKFIKLFDCYPECAACIETKELTQDKIKLIFLSYSFLLIKNIFAAHMQDVIQKPLTKQTNTEKELLKKANKTSQNEQTLKILKGLIAWLSSEENYEELLSVEFLQQYFNSCTTHSSYSICCLFMANEEKVATRLINLFHKHAEKIFTPIYNYKGKPAQSADYSFLKTYINNFSLLQEFDTALRAIILKNRQPKESSYTPAAIVKLHQIKDKFLEEYGISHQQHSQNHINRNLHAELSNHLSVILQFIKTKCEAITNDQHATFGPKKFRFSLIREVNSNSKNSELKNAAHRRMYSR